MKTTETLKALDDLTVGQWGMVTTAQAAARGVTRLQLSRLAEQGHIERIGQGIYRDSGVPTERFDAVKAAWLSIDPKLTAQARLSLVPFDAIASGATAAYLLGLGDLVPEPYQFTVPARRQTQRKELVFRVKRLPEDSITLREGIPVTTPEQTIADLVEGGTDRSLVADVVADIDVLDSGKLIALLSPLAGRNGFKPGDGSAFCAELERLARRDVDSLAKAIATTPLATKIAEEYLKAIDPAAIRELQLRLSELALPVETMAAVRDSLDGVTRFATPQLGLDFRTRKQLIEMVTRMKSATRATAKEDGA